MRDIIQQEKKAWADLVSEMKAISQQVAEGKDVDMANLAKNVKKYRQLHDKRAVAPREASKI